MLLVKLWGMTKSLKPFCGQKLPMERLSWLTLFHAAAVFIASVMRNAISKSDAAEMVGGWILSNSFSDSWNTVELVNHELLLFSEFEELLLVFDCTPSFEVSLDDESFRSESPTDNNSSLVGEFLDSFGGDLMVIGEDLKDFLPSRALEIALTPLSSLCTLTSSSRFNLVKVPCSPTR